jgi:zinc-ribbon domain
MFCPNCGQERISESTSFCSRCGYLLTGTADLLKMGGSLPTLETPNGQSQRSRGVKQGLFVMILGVALFPIIGILTTFLFRMTPWPAGVVLFTLFFGGLLRMAYALMFEPKYPQGLPPAASLHIDSQLTGQQANSALPPTSFVPPVTGKTGRWLDTNELEPHSVTESTTKLLELEDDK